MTQKMEQKFKEIEERTLKLVHQAQSRYELARRVHSNCNNMQYDRKYAWLRDLDAQGTHLEDPVYQKLERLNYGYSDRYYVQDALSRVGNRTMTEEEYNLILEAEDKDLIYASLCERVQNIKDKIDKKKSSNGGVWWAQGPFFSGGPRNKYDPFHKAQKLGYNREARK